MVDPITRQTIGICDHEITFERYVIDFLDFRTLHYAVNPSLNMRAPINGAATVRIWIKGEEVFSDDPIYGWALYPDPNRADAAQQTDAFQKILFNLPVRLVNPLIEVSYLTRQQYCMKCSGLGTINDLKPMASGGFLRIFQQSKLAQKGLKWVLTSRCSFYPTFVCPLKSYIGKKLGIQLSDSDIQAAVQTALSTMQQVQQAQQTVQSLDPLEMIKDIQFVSATIDPTDPTSLDVSISITTFTGAAVPIAFQMGVNQ